METDLSGFDIDAPRWDQGTFLGRVKHFFNITDPRTVLVPERRLDWAKVTVERSRVGAVPPGTQVEQLLYAKKLYDSAFHPDTGEKMNVIGRMSFQVPGGMIITGFMLHFYRTMPAVIFWQWVNQSFNALVNYTNRNAASPTSVRQMAFSYLTATTTAVATAVGMNMLTKRAPPLVCRWVPFAAVAAANCVNIPMMRQQELIQGISVKDKNHNEVGHSQRAAAIGITQVVISRITMAAPGMTGGTLGSPGPLSTGPVSSSLAAGPHGEAGDPALHEASSSWCRWRVGCSLRHALSLVICWTFASQAPCPSSWEDRSVAKGLRSGRTKQARVEGSAGQRPVTIPAGSVRKSYLE
ncbi:PREDICTED: sideroflexin-2 isoform X4 [Chinchilla lanigera]|uniref:sideroflexin-2 isoform X4 n=1 Tax=Chinchilla lanigera TaxID=34839 RepID=UPI000697FDBD|nr:PREDICTED: sideroflexin-2 isoform X4 [Chinchilla lanigera]